MAKIVCKFDDLVRNCGEEMNRIGWECMHAHACVGWGHLFYLVRGRFSILDEEEIYDRGHQFLNFGGADGTIGIYMQWVL